MSKYYMYIVENALLLISRFRYFKFVRNSEILVKLYAFNCFFIVYTHPLSTSIYMHINNIRHITFITCFLILHSSWVEDSVCGGLFEV